MSDANRLIEAISRGDQHAAERLLPLVYAQLHALAKERMVRERPGHTLQATALVHEAYLKLIGPREVPWRDAKHFYAAAAEAIRQILMDHAKGRGRKKRGGNYTRLPINVADLAANDNLDQIVALDEAVRRLEMQEPEAAEVVRLRFYAGLSIDQTAEALEISPRTVDRRWKFARAWLYQCMEADAT